MPKPPDDDLLDRLILQLGDALQALPPHPGDSRSHPEEGLRDALGDLDTPEEPGLPAMRLLHGGRSSPPAHGEPPPTPLREQPRRRVVRTAGLVNLGRRGPITLDSAQDSQTLYRGTTPHPYRVFATSGTLLVSLDGTVVERITAGRSTDLCGTLLQVRGEAAATGVYLRLD